MTREEAITILQKIKPTPCRADGKSTTHTLATIALDMAIKALEQEPCEDCISRQAVNKLVDELARAISDEKCHIQRGRNYGRIIRDILELPSVEPEQKGRDCASCKHSNNGECAYTEECHKCMWESQYEKQVEPEWKKGKWQRRRKMIETHIKALTRIKENYERLWKENLLSEDLVREEYEAVCAGIEALENLIPQVCSVPQEEKKDEG